MKKKIFTFVISFALFSKCNYAQNVEISKDVKENIEQQLGSKLIPAIDSLVAQISRNEIKDNMLWNRDHKFSKAIFKEVHNYEKSFQNSIYKSKVGLLNLYPIGKGSHLCQLAFYKQTDENSKSLQMIFNVVAHNRNDTITFGTPLNYYTSTWKEKQVGQVKYIFRDSINLERAELFAKKNIFLASKFKKRAQPFKFFMVNNYQEILRLLGFDYNVKTIRKLRDGFGVVGDEIIFSIMNNEDFSHDVFHYYSETIHDWSIRNWVVEEGLAYNWGNAYYTKQNGEISELPELISVLKKYLKKNKKTDLLSLFKNNFWKDTSGVIHDLAPDIQIGRAISALICEEVYKKHGMEGIDKLLVIGSKPDHFEPFFKAINNLVEINKSNFNKKVMILINSYEPPVTNNR